MEGARVLVGRVLGGREGVGEGGCWGREGARVLGGRVLGGRVLGGMEGVGVRRELGFWEGGCWEGWRVLEEGGS